MAQQSVQLNKNLLKHLRKDKRETQAETAEACQVTERHYQNIERYGRTTTEKIQLIAKHFDISPEELSTNINSDNSLWYITTPFSIDGEIARGYYQTIEDITSRAKVYGDGYEPRLTIIDGTQVKKISITFFEDELTWSIRPIELNEKIGLVWAELSDWQKDTWETTRDRLLYGCVEKVCLDGDPLVPEGSASKFIVQFTEYGQRKIIDTGHRIFNSAAEFRVSFSEWLDTVPISHPRRSQPGMFYMNYDDKDEMTKAIRIYKVWVNEHGEIKRAPWSAANIDDLMKTITDRKRGKFVPLPIGINESFDGEEIAPFEPDVTYKKVTELPEIRFSIKFE